VDACFKVNMPDLLAAVGLAQLRKADHFLARRRQIAEAYLRAFRDLEELEMPPLSEGHSWHLFIVRIRSEMLTKSRNEMIAELKNHGIGTSVHFIPLHLHPYYQRQYGYKQGDFPNAEDAYARAISLPIFPDMTEAEIQLVINSVKRAVKESRRRVLVEVA
jgi:dTDP-4-amino-4,6-dideoxygalactose transaminase